MKIKKSRIKATKLAKQHFASLLADQEQPSIHYVKLPESVCRSVTAAQLEHALLVNIDQLVAELNGSQIEKLLRQAYLLREEAKTCGNWIEAQLRISQLTWDKLELVASTVGLSRAYIVLVVLARMLARAKKKPSQK